MKTRVVSVLASACALAVVSATAITPASAQPRPGPAKIVPPPPPPELVGLTETGSLTPDRGFIDDPTATDGTNLAVIVTDSGSMVELRVLGPDGVSHATVNLADVSPTVRRLYLQANRVFVVADDPAGGPVTAALVGFDGKIIRRHARATDLTLRAIGGKDTVIAYTRSNAAAGEQHQVALFDLVSGKKVAKKGGKVVIGSDGRDGKLDLRVDYWLDDHTVVAGLRGGVWRKREDQRSPDTRAMYDLVTSKWVKDEPITNLLEHARRLETLVAHSGERVFVHIPSDGGDAELWRDGVTTKLTLDPPLATYDPGSLRWAVRGERVWFSLTVDPVNPAAVERKKADPEYLDLFEVDGARAVRKARIYAPKKKFSWGWAGDTLWVLEKNVGFGRGGKSLRLFRLAP